MRSKPRTPRAAAGITPSPRSPDGSIAGLGPTLSDVLAQRPASMPPIMLEIRSARDRDDALALPPPAPIELRAAGSSRAVASPPEPAQRELPPPPLPRVVL